uniref:Uncharacterized protein n=1 Tax=Panthera leo TaxID=9689 RepID=A0A8C8X0Z6_PANLE
AVRGFEPRVGLSPACVSWAGVVPAQYVFTLKRNVRQKSKVTEMPVSKPCISGCCILSMLLF